MVKFADRLIVTIQQGGTIERAFNALDGIFENIATDAVVFSCNPNHYCQLAAE
jgi:hypothetical protein